jgi:transcriptional regulator with XRE-family HTH domain
MDDQRVGAILRALRRRRGWRQLDVANAAGLAQTTVSLIERGHLDRLSTATVRRVFGTVDARFESVVRWRGGDLDRLLDLRHVQIQEQVTRLISRWDWRPFPEISYARYGERGSIDVLGWHAATRTAAVFEIKSQIGSIEATHRKHDEKVRLAPSICFERWGWRPVQVGRILVLPESARLRRVVHSHLGVFGAGYPASSREVKSWLRRPNGAIAGLWFLTLSNRDAARVAPGAGCRRIQRQMRESKRGSEPGEGPARQIAGDLPSPSARVASR